MVSPAQQIWWGRFQVPAAPGVTKPCGRILPIKEKEFTIPGDDSALASVVVDPVLVELGLWLGESAVAGLAIDLRGPLPVWARCDAETSPERVFYYSASTHSAGKLIVAGWSYSWITALDWANTTWTAPMDARRILSRADATDLTVSQVRDLVTRLGHSTTTPVFCFDAGYDAIALTTNSPTSESISSAPGTACTPSAAAADTGSTMTSHRSWPAP